MRNKLYLKILIGLSLIVFCLFFFDKPFDYSNYNYNYSTTIHRDNWGVPHIYGKNDNDVVVVLPASMCAMIPMFLYMLSL